MGSRSQMAMLAAVLVILCIVGTFVIFAMDGLFEEKRTYRSTLWRIR